MSFYRKGLPSDGTMNAVIAYMLADWYRPGVTLDFPKGKVYLTFVIFLLFCKSKIDFT